MLCICSHLGLQQLPRIPLKRGTSALDDWEHTKGKTDRIKYKSENASTFNLQQHE